MSKNNIIIALVVLCLLGTIWGSVKDKKSKSLERQLTAMKQQTSSTVAPAASGSAAGDVPAAVAEAEKLKSQNKELLASVAALKKNLTSQEQEIADLQKEMAGADDGSQAISLLEEKLGSASHEMDKLEAALTGAKVRLEEKSAALAAAEESLAAFEEIKGSLANSVDSYSAKNQELSAEIETYAQRIHSLENALEERTKRLVANGEELARTKLNMNVLLSKIAAQNDSLAILEETRVALEKELASKFQLLESLQQQFNTQVVVEDAGTEEVEGAEEVERVEGAEWADDAPEQAAQPEEVPAH